MCSSDLFDASALTGKQRHFKKFLKAPNQSTGGALGDVKLLGRAGKTIETGNRLECANGIERWEQASAHSQHSFKSWNVDLYAACGLSPRG